MTDRKTGTRDVTYDVVSVLYHALQAAETCGVYQEDAQGRGDQEAADFFRDAQQQQKQLADGAKRLLGQRLS